MKTPICSFDAKTEILCSRCESKLKSGQLTEGDIEASYKFAKLAQKNGEIDKFTLVSAQKIDDEIVVYLKNSDMVYLRSNSQILEKIKKAFENRIWLIESGSSDKRFLENLLFPIKISLLNLVWLPDGNKLTKIIIPTQKTKIEIEKLKKIAQTIKKIELIIEFEKGSK